MGLLSRGNADTVFPLPQYLGAKYQIRDWIAKFIPNNADTVLDAFSGSQSIAYKLKQLGKSVITNDFMRFNALIGRALIENSDQTLDANDIDILFSNNFDNDYYNLMENLFTNIFFSLDDAKFLDSFRSNISRLSNKYKKALAFTIICRAITRKITMGHFAHAKAMEYASDISRIKRNPSLTTPIKELFLDIVNEYNSAIFSNGKINKSYNQNILKLLGKPNKVDVVYFDPPYCGSHADYQSFYHLLETYVRYWKDKNFINKVNRYEPKEYSGFDKKSEVIYNFKQLFKKAHDIPVWLISYNDRSYPDIKTFTKLILPHRKVTIKKRKYHMGRGGKGSVAGSNEILLICE